MADRVTEDDLLLAAEWLDEYEEGADGQAEMLRMHKVAAWLRKQAEDRQREAAVRTAMRKTGAPRRVVMRALETVRTQRQMEAERVATL
jgi:hypothetical protein